MEITWLGHSCFRLKGKTASVVTDPYDASIGPALGNPTADIVTVSMETPAHNCAAAVGQARRVLRRPGEYEVAGVTVTGLIFPSSLKDVDAPLRNVVYLFEMDDMRLCHLGALAHVPTEKEAAELGRVHTLMAPVGGHGSLEAKQAAEIVRLIEPNVVIPMGYKSKATKAALDPIDGFLKEMGVKTPTTQPKYTITMSNLPNEMQVVVLETPVK
ncbi:MAG: MBL fold metallo-hydrolase [Chloroflexi bacterium]|nr:MBL fold metallo-hydrolase [Chloroflexota bacterium]